MNRLYQKWGVSFIQIIQSVRRISNTHTRILFCSSRQAGSRQPAGRCCIHYTSPKKACRCAFSCRPFRRIMRLTLLPASRTASVATLACFISTDACRCRFTTLISRTRRAMSARLMIIILSLSLAALALLSGASSSSFSDNDNDNDNKSSYRRSELSINWRAER